MVPRACLMSLGVREKKFLTTTEAHHYAPSPRDIASRMLTSCHSLSDVHMVRPHLFLSFFNMHMLANRCGQPFHLSYFVYDGGLHIKGGHKLALILVVLISTSLLSDHA
jgi:hypothetical protein